MNDFSELNNYLMDVIVVDSIRQSTIELCENLLLLEDRGILLGVETLLAMSSEGEAASVIDDLNRLLFQHAYEMTQDMGIVWDIDALAIEDLHLLADVINAMILIDGVEDAGGLSAILNDDLTNEEKFTDILSEVLAKDMSGFLDRAVKVQNATIAGIATAIYMPEEPIELAHFVTERLQKHGNRFRSGIIYDYLMSGGVLGAVEYNSLLKLYEDKIITIGNSGDVESTVNALVGFCLISNTPNARVEKTVASKFEYYFDDADFIIKLAKELKGYGL